MSEINITPLTDVLLVLLIIFLVTATAATQNAFNMNMPAAAREKKVELEADYVLVTVSERGDIFIGENRVENPEADLLARLKDWQRKKGTDKVVIQADAKARYRFIIQVIDASKRAGLDKISLATEAM